MNWHPNNAKLSAYRARIKEQEERIKELEKLAKAGGGVGGASMEEVTGLEEEVERLREEASDLSTRLAQTEVFFHTQRHQWTTNVQMHATHPYSVHHSAQPPT